MDNKALSPSLLFTISSILTVLGYILYEIVDSGLARKMSGRTSKNTELSYTVSLMGITV